MPQCEMCGAEVASLTTSRVEGAELQVCDDCTEFGTEVETETSSTSTKYSTSSSDGSSGGSGSSGSSAGGDDSGGGRRRDMFDEMDELAPDYGDRIREAREAEELSQADLAQEMGEKASLVRKLEHGDSLPSDEVQRKVERRLEISLVGEAADEDAEWSSDNAGDGLTLGDMVQRED